VPIFVKEPSYGGVAIDIEIERMLVRRETPYQEVIIADTPGYGRALFLDGHIQSARADEALYHEHLVHPSLVIHGAPRRVLIGGTGEGASLREVLRHPTVERVVAVDIDAEVVALCREHLPEWSAGAFDDPRVEARTGDFMATLAESAAGSWDVVITDLTDPVDEGPSVHLWGTPFFEAIARVLADDGILVVQSGEADPVDLEALRTVRSTMAAVFPHVAVCLTFVPSFHCLWAFTLASKRPVEVAPPDLEARIARLPAARLRAYSATSHRAAFAIPPFLADMLREPGTIVRGAGDMDALALPSS